MSDIEIARKANKKNLKDIADKLTLREGDLHPFGHYTAKIDLSNLTLSNLSFIGCGSSTLPLEAQKEFINQYNIGVGNLYGLSETGPTHIDDPRENNWQPGSIGLPLEVNECKVSEDVELLIKGDNVFIGYYKNENL